MTPPILRLTCTYTPVQGQALRATVVAGVLIHQQLIELQQYCGNVGGRPGDLDAPKARMTPADEKTYTRMTAVLSAVRQFATAHAWVVRKGIFAPQGGLPAEVYQRPGNAGDAAPGRPLGAPHEARQRCRP
jgi:hypothetical protein